MNKSYYAIIPANVRYDEDLPPNAKLLYGEITALCNEKGYCWAKNNYFAELYGVKKETVSRWISTLVKKGYIKLELIYQDGTKEVKDRYIYINHGVGIDKKDNTYCENNQGGIDEKINTPIDKKVKDNNTSINNTINNTDIYIGELFDYWNQQNIIKHRSLTAKTKSHINARLEDYSKDELTKAISNYKMILNDDKYYWTHKWSLQDFMKPNNVTRFVDEAEPLNNFLSSKKGGANNARDENARELAQQNNLPF